MELMYWWLPIALCALAISLVVLAWRRMPPRKQNNGRILVANTSRLRQLPEYRSAIRRAIRMRWLAVVALVAALAGAGVAASRWVYTEVHQPQSFNRDIVLCLDVSGSMVDYDAEVIDRYLEMLPGFNGERVSLVVWNATAVPVFPLTDDYAFVEEQLTQMRDAMRDHKILEYSAGTLNKPGASLVGDGVASCLLQFENVRDRNQPTASEDRQPRSRSVILATDNVVNGSQSVSFEEAAQLAASYDIKLYGLDANTFHDAFQQEYEGLMRRHGFEYFQLTDDDSVDTIVEAITSEQASRWQGAPQVLVIDTPAIWLMIATAGAIVMLAAQWRNRT